jgi:hypothetical protein
VASFDGPRNGPGDNPEPGGSRGPGDDRRADLGPAADLRRRTENLPVTIRAGLREREAELGRSLEAHDRPTDRRDLVMQRLDHANILRERGEIRTALGAPDKAHQDLVDSRAALKQGWQDAEPMTGLTGSRMRINVLATAAEHAAADGDPEGANGHLDHARQTLFEWRPATVGAKAYADRTVPVWDLVRLCYAEHRAAVRLMEQEQDPAAGDSEVAWLWLNRIEQRYGKVPRSDPLWPQLKGAEAVAAVRSGRAGDLKKLSGTVANASKAFERLDSPRPDRAARLHLAMTRELVGWSNKTEGPEGGPIWEAAASNLLWGREAARRALEQSPGFRRAHSLWGSANWLELALVATAQGSWFERNRRALALHDLAIAGDPQAPSLYQQHRRYERRPAAGVMDLPVVSLLDPWSRPDGPVLETRY